MLDERLHRGLVGRPNSRRLLNSPVLIVDRDALERNIAKMAEFAKRSGVALRPHAKTHKSVEIARRQISGGALGVCCAKLGEAEALVEGDIRSVLITSPIVTPPAIERLMHLNERGDLMVVVDNADNVATLAAAARGRPLNVIVDIDPGIRRTGVATPEAALDLARRTIVSRTLKFRGLQMYCGMQQHIASYAERETALRERMQYLHSIITLLAKNGMKPEIVTGAGTGTHRIDATLGVFTEWQVGSYVFMDRQYTDCQIAADGSAGFEYSLFVDTHVISANTPGMATIDAGFKALATDGGPPAIVSGAPSGTAYHFMGDEHGAVVDPAFKHVWKIGEVVRLAVPHCDPTVNLYDSYHVVDGETLIDIWPVSARGRSR